MTYVCVSIDGSSGDADQHRAGQQVPDGQSTRRIGGEPVVSSGTVTETSWAPCKPVRGSWTADSATSTQGTAHQTDLARIGDDQGVRPEPVAATAREPAEQEAKCRLELGGSAPRARSAAYRAASTKPSDGDACAATRTVCVNHSRASASSAVSWPRVVQSRAAQSAARVRQRRRQITRPPPATLSTTSRKDSRSRLIELTC